jgi:NAD(P)H-nitrite reductase large subunit
VPKYVIVGASAAGIGAVEAIREVDPVGTVAVISDEECPQYSRPMISDLISGKADFSKMMCREHEFWAKNNIQALTGRTATSLNLSDRYVTLDKGDHVNFEKLLIATGGKPFVPKIEGSDKDGVFTFTTLSDAENMLSKLEKAESAVVIGAGLIGVSVKQILGKPENDRVVGGAVLTSGEQVPCDLVIIAIGVIPRTELVAGTDVKTNRGILVDRSMRTNVSDVYASGDVAEAYDFVIGENRLLPLWPLAQLEGKVAGYNMAGKKAGYPGGTAMSALKYFGMPIISIGLANPKDPEEYESLVKYELERSVYRKIVLKDNVIVGVTLVNAIENAGIIFHLMKNGVNVKKFKQELVSEDFCLATLPRSLRRKLYPGEYK